MAHSSPPDKVSQTMPGPRYMHVPTFLRTATIDDPAALDIALVGVPYDGAVTNRPGARHGPRELRNASTNMRSIHHVSRINPYELCRIGDVGDVPFTDIYDIEAAHREITEFFSRFSQAGVTTLAAGGDHSITLAIFRALASIGPLGLIQIDAHTDTRDESLGSKYNHGTPFRRAVEENLLDPHRTVQVGIRGPQNGTDGWDYSRDSGMRVIFMEEFTRLGVERVVAEAREILGDGPTYVSFDIDSLDPAFAPGTGTPEVGGLTTIEALELVRGLRGLNLVGADVVEVAPAYDPTGNTALVGATLMYELVCLLAESRSSA
jgi:guanidinopropionase